MPLLGAHMSIAGGYHRAAEAAGALGMETIQVFTKSNAQWAAKPISDEEAAAFSAAVKAAKLEKPCAHASYLINLASPNEELWRKSVAAFAVELERAERLGLAGVVVHPGTAKGCDEATGLANVARGLDAAFGEAKAERVEAWLETTAGQGASLGHRFEHLAELVERPACRARLGVCLDTCHVFAAGYPSGTAEEYAEAFGAFDRLIGLGRLRAVHLNDSKKPLGSRVDRHEHIGEGELGLEPFRRLLNDPRLASLPMFLETPKGLRDGVELDAVNLRTLRALMSRADPVAGKVRQACTTGPAVMSGTSRTAETARPAFRDEAAQRDRPDPTIRQAEPAQPDSERSPRPARKLTARRPGSGDADDDRRSQRRSHGLPGRRLSRNGLGCRRLSRSVRNDRMRRPRHGAGRRPHAGHADERLCRRRAARRGVSDLRRHGTAVRPVEAGGRTTDRRRSVPHAGRGSSRSGRLAACRASAARCATAAGPGRCGPAERRFPHRGPCRGRTKSMAGKAYVRLPNPYIQPQKPLESSPNPFAAADSRPTPNSRSTVEQASLSNPNPFAVADGLQAAGYRTAPDLGNASPIGPVVPTGVPSNPADDRRLPPGEPLGGANPFSAASTREEPTARSSHVRVLAPRPIGWRSASATAANTIGAETFPRVNVAPKVGFVSRTRDVRNPGMIVDTDAVPNRSDMRSEALSKPAESRPFIQPRRPFAPPGWEPIDDDVLAVASANVPTALSSLDAESDNRIVAFRPPVAEETPQQPPVETEVVPARPVADSATKNPFGDDQPFPGPDLGWSDAVASNDETPALDGPLLAPGPAFEPIVRTTDDAPPAEPVQVATAVPAKPRTRLAEYGSGAVPQPLSLDEAERVASAENGDRRRTSGPVGPVTIGFGLAAVAIAVVAVRRRFA